MRIVALLAVVPLLAACGLFGGDDSSDTPAAKKVAATGFRPGNVTFGVLAPLSGPLQARGQDLVDGARLAAADLNVRGGVMGQKVGVVTADDACEAAAGRASAEQLEARDGLAGALGGVCGSAAAAAARTLGAGSLPFLVTSANSPAIVSAKRTPTAYLTDGTPYQAALAAVRWLTYLAAQRLAVVTEDDRSSAYLGRETLGLASPVPKAVSRQTVPAATSDWAQVAKTVLASKADAVYWAGSAANAGALVAALRAAGYDGSFLASQQSESPEFLSAAGDAADGAFVITNASPQNLPAAAEWARRFTEKYGRAPTRDAMLAYDALRALAQAVTQSGKVDRERNSQQLASLDDNAYSTFLGGLHFAPDHTVRDDNHIVLTVKSGAFTVANTLRSETEAG